MRSGTWYVPKPAFSNISPDLVHQIVRVKKNQTGVQNKTFKMYQVIEGLKDPQTWGYGIIALTTTLPTSGLGAFANIIISSFGFSVLETQLLAMVLGFYILIVLLSSAWLVKKTNQNLLVMLAYCLPSFVGTALLMTVQPTNMPRKVGMLICYYITLSFWSAQTLNLAMVSRNIAGQTKKTVVVASNFIIWAAGNAIGKHDDLTPFRLSSNFLPCRTSGFSWMGCSPILHRLLYSSRLLCASRWCDHLPPLLSQAPEQEER